MRQRPKTTANNLTTAIPHGHIDPSQATAQDHTHTDMHGVVWRRVTIMEVSGTDPAVRDAEFTKAEYAFEIYVTPLHTVGDKLKILMQEHGCIWSTDTHVYVFNPSEEQRDVLARLVTRKDILDGIERGDKFLSKGKYSKTIGYTHAP